jgi:hypothetical protein
MRFQVLKALSMKMAVFGHVAPCSLVEVYQYFTGAYCLIIRDLMAKAVSTSEAKYLKGPVHVITANEYKYH